MMRRLAKTALLGALLLGVSCQDFSWTGRSGQVDEEAAARGVKDVESLEREYETQRFWANQRRNMDGRWRALGNGLERVGDTFDRHFFNYPRPKPAQLRF